MTGTKGKRQIQPVADRFDKQKTYMEQMERYYMAIKHGFNLEAIMIDYACMEDRLRYMLYYLGVIEKESDYKITGKSYRVRCFRDILHEYIDPKMNMSITSISGKRSIVRSIFCMAGSDNRPNDSDKQRRLLWDALNDEKHIKEILLLLDEIESWCGYRNEIVHCLLNKNLESLYERIGQQTEEGYRLFRRLDSQVQWVKRKRLREKMKLTP